jgi:hypothetical protein
MMLQVRYIFSRETAIHRDKKGRGCVRADGMAGIREYVAHPRFPRGLKSLRET